PAGQGRGERQGSPSPAPTTISTAPVSKAFALVTRALQLLTDREVTPQLGLLKSTLLQLDSTFSERDYGASSFRDFADKLAEAGLVVLRSAGRSVLVELREGHVPVAHEAAEAAQADADVQPGAQPAADHEAQPVSQHDAQPEASPTSIIDGIRLFQRVLATPGAIARWPMYIRNAKQAMRALDPGFDERKHGNLVEILRSVQRDGLIRLDRDRQGVLRVFQGPQLKPVPVAAPEAVDLQPDLDLVASDAAGQGEAPADRAADTPDSRGLENAGGDAASTEAGMPVVDDTVEPSHGPGQTEPADAKPKRRRKTGAAAPGAKSTVARKPRVRTTPPTPRKRKEPETA
ncbi:MAG: hypothetical protein NTY02_18855, partial [Acidobacteria bacterium]|nr:hypothetical protein [Acidobacteriota bacterium]